jgi:riboflavin kinase/FMN adenylyltransferase
MQHYSALQDVSLKDAWLTIGSFDGVHLGHRQILENLTAGAHAVGAPAVVLTFYPHPTVVLHGPRESFYLTTPEEKAALLGQAGVDVVITQPFNLTVAEVSARDFLQELQTHLAFKQLWVGYDFAMGYNREGDVPALEALGEEMGYTLHTIKPVNVNGEVVSSTVIRNLLLQGDVQRAASLLGRFYHLSGKVVHGDGRGGRIGIPTANLATWIERVVPQPGVYVCYAHIGGQTWGAVTNIGVRPTFDTETVIPQIEAHFLDFDADIYGQELTLDFIARLRNEKRFSGVDELVTQIETDIARARTILKEMPSGQQS